METKAKPKSKSSSSPLSKSNNKAEPLTDLTNINLIPISTLRKLCESTKPSSNFPQNSRNSKPSDASSTASSAKKGLDNANASSNCSSKSDTSIGSSSFNHNGNAAVNPNNAAELTAKTRRVAPTPTPPLGDGGSQHVYIRRQTDEKTKSAGEADSVPSDSGPLEKTKNKGKAITAPSDSNHLEKTKDEGKAITMPSSRLIPLENAKEKVKAVVIPSVSFDSTRLKKTNEKGKAITVPSSGRIPVKNTEDKRKALAAPSDNPASVTRSNRGKVGLIPLSFRPEKTEDKGKSIAMPSSRLPPHKAEEKRKKVVAAFSCPPLPKMRSMRKGSNEAGDEPPKLWTDLRRKQRKKRCIRQKTNSEDSLPRDFVEQQKAYFREVDEFELPEEEISYHELDKEE